MNILYFNFEHVAIPEITEKDHYQDDHLVSVKTEFFEVTKGTAIDIYVSISHNI